MLAHLDARVIRVGGLEGDGANERRAEPRLSMGWS